MTICQNGNCCTTDEVGPLSRGSSKTLTVAELADCNTKKIINIKSYAPISVKFHNKSDDHYKGKTARIYTSNASYKCAMTQWIETAADSISDFTVKCPNQGWFKI